MHELGGTPFILTQLAETVSDASGREVGCTDLSVEQYAQVLVSVGLPEPLAAAIADGERGIADGELLDRRDLQPLGRGRAAGGRLGSGGAVARSQRGGGPDVARRAGIDRRRVVCVMPSDAPRVAAGAAPLPRRRARGYPPEVPPP